MKNFDFLNIKINKGILTITIDRIEQHNALNLKLLDELELVFNDAYSNKDVKGVLITGAGKKSFVAGADIKEFTNFNSQEGKRMVLMGQKVYKLIEDCPKPVLAAINGFALGGGCELAMACHLRIASENAIFGQPEVKLGIIPAYGGTQRMSELIGKTMAFELLMTGDTINAQEAKKIGLINRVVSYDNLISESEQVLSKILDQSTVAIKSVIKCVNDYYNKSVDGYDTEISEFTKCLEEDDFKEGTCAFIEKRKPIFNR